MYQLPPHHLDDIEAFDTLTQAFLQGHAEPVKYKATRVPMGIYEQRTDGTYMVRIRCAGGFIKPSQLKEVTKVARIYGSRLLHLTTRQELQIQNIDLKNTAQILRDLHAIGLSTKGGGGNTVRNILVSVDSGIDAQEVFDVTPVAFALTGFLIARNDSFNLPRKFKIAFSNTEADTSLAHFNDLGFIARTHNGQQGFGVYLGGSVGNKPMPGYELFKFIPVADVAIVAEAAKQFFNQFGNRRNRHKARLRYIFYKLGKNEVFRLFFEVYHQLLHEKSIAPLEVQTYHFEHYQPNLIAPADITPEFELWKNRYTSTQKQNGLFKVVIPFVNGNTNDVVLSSIAAFAELFGDDTLRFSLRQDLQLRNIPEAFLPNLYQLLKGLDIEVDAHRLINNLVSCTGADTCRLGICQSKGAVQAIKRQLQVSNLPLDQIKDLRINLSGCPNSCGQQMVADLGFYGKIGRNDRIYPAYYVVGGARLGTDASLALTLGEVSARDLPAFTSRLLHYYLAHQKAYASFTDFVEQESMGAIAKLLKEFAEIPPYEENKDYYRDWGVEQPFSLAGRGQGECAAGMFDMIDVDLKIIREILGAIAENPATSDSALIYRLVFYTSRMLLVTRGVEPKNETQVFEGFINRFIDDNLIDNKYRHLVALAASNPDYRFAEFKLQAIDLAHEVIELYEQLDDTLQFKGVQKIQDKAETSRLKDLRGVACPMNFVKTKIELSTLQSGDILEILLDDGAPIQNVPASVANEGHKVLSQKRVNGHWAVVIEKVEV